MKFISTKLWAFLSLLLIAPYTNADIAGVKLGFAVWNHEPSGSVRYQGTDTNAESGFQLTDESQGFFWLAIEHPVPGLPNIKFTHTKLSNSGSGILNNSFTFGGNTFNAAENINTVLDLDQTDLTLYYELIDTGVHLDLGLTLKYLDGTARVNSVTTSQTRSVDFEGVLPLIYGSFDVKFPLTGLSAGVSANVISYSGHSFSDVQFKLAYKTKANIGIAAGYRRMQVKLDDLDGVFSDLKFSGPYASVFFHF